MYFCTIQTPIPARNGLYLWEPHTPRHHYHNNDALCSAVLITIPRNLLLQNNAVDARFEQRKHKARLALEVAQPVEDLGARVRGDGVKEMSELRGGQSPYFVFILPPRLVRLPQGIARGAEGWELRTFFMFSERRSYSSRTSCSSGVSSGGEDSVSMAESIFNP